MKEKRRLPVSSITGNYKANDMVDMKYESPIIAFFLQQPKPP